MAKKKRQLEILLKESHEGVDSSARRLLDIRVFDRCQLQEYNVP